MRALGPKLNVRLGEEQCAFRYGRWCMDKVLEKYLETWKDVFWVVMDFE